MNGLSMTGIMKKWSDATVVDPAIQSFCLERYGKQAKIFTGFDRKPPKDEDCPHVVLLPDIKNTGMTHDNHHYSFIAGWVIKNAQKTESSDGLQITYSGIEECEMLGDLVWNCICEINPSYPLSKSDVEYYPTTFFPQFKGLMTVTLDVPVVLGANLPPY